jgi:hypothetical protein
MQNVWLALASLILVLCVEGPAFADFLGDVVRSIQAQNVTIGAIQNAQKSVQAAAPANIQPQLDKIFEDLSNLPDERLYILNAAPDVCSTPQILDCRGVPTATVKPFVAMALDRRKAEHTDNATRQSFYVASGGFRVSVLSLLLGGYGALRQKKRQPR